MTGQEILLAVPWSIEVAGVYQRLAVVLTATAVITRSFVWLFVFAVFRCIATSIKNFHSSAYLHRVFIHINITLRSYCSVRSQFVTLSIVFRVNVSSNVPSFAILSCNRESFFACCSLLFDVKLLRGGRFLFVISWLLAAFINLNMKKVILFKKK